MKKTEEMEKIAILEKEYFIVDVIEYITIPDCFVIKNKVGMGHGEAKLYIGQRSNQNNLKLFFENFKNIEGFFLKKDLKGYLENAKFEYEEKEQGYNNNISDYWSINMKKVNSVNDIEYFNIEESEAGGNRFYIKNSQEKVYKLFREIMLPSISYVSILKLLNVDNDKIYYYFRPFLDYFYDKRSTTQKIKDIEIEIKNENISDEKKEVLTKSRIGQGKYRQLILEEFPAGCLITQINDERILIASHIKPWVNCNDQEKISRYNGLLLSPTFDRLFDQGFITFEKNGIIKTSPYVSPLNWKKIGLQNNKKFDLKQNNERDLYLHYHKEKIFKGIL